MNNMFIIIGRLTKDIDFRENEKNKIGKMSIAVQNGKDDTTFMDIIIFSQTAETTWKYCKKGDLVAVKGIIKNNNWTDDKGNKHFDYSFVGNKVSFLNTSKKSEPVNKDPFEDFGQQVTIDDNFLD